jgi:hypothetical protein
MNIATQNFLETDLFLQRYDDSLRDEWDDFVVNKSINGTFLHTRKFYDHNPLNAIDDHSFIIYNNSKISAVIPFTLVNDGTTLKLDSHPRCTYGGFIISPQVHIKDSVIMIEMIIKYAKNIDIGEIIIRNPFRILYNVHSDEMDYAMWYHGFTIKCRQLEIAIELTHNKDLQSKYTKGTKSGVSKAKKLLRAEESEEYEAFWTLLEKTLISKYNARPTHNFQNFCTLKECVGGEKIKLFVTKQDGKIIAGVLVFLVNDLCVHAQYIAFDIEYQNMRPLNLLIDYIANWAYNSGYRYFNLGMANEDEGRVINYNLFKFKESYGGRGILRETMQLTL